ncbi:MAG: glycosyltransferase family 4 protein [Nitrospira sp.]|nr:glycosyltransferase family 4 protein [Nitrospira sp.]
MRILLCSERYAPSVGGVQEVLRQLAERLVRRGHEVTVATSKLNARHFSDLNGVRLKEFRVSGNWVRGMVGEVEEYRRFIVEGSHDVILIKAAQQWTFDALWPVLPAIKAGKVFIPCGFSRLYEPEFAEYFRQLPSVLRHFDHLIFYTSDYRDINFAKRHGCRNYSIIPNGASEEEFARDRDPSFRARHDIGSDDLLILSVGSLCEEKGHLDTMEAFLSMDLGSMPSTLMLNCKDWENEEGSPSSMSVWQRYADYGRMVLQLSAHFDSYDVIKHVAHGLLNRVGIRRSHCTAIRPSYKDRIAQTADRIRRQGTSKHVLITDLDRSEVIQAFLNADLYVCASHIEYSPLVLFEAAAAGTPFLSVPVGNAEEIARWTGAGVICPARKDERGYTMPNPSHLAEHMTDLAKDRNTLRRMGAAGRTKWRERFTWDHIVEQYERILVNVSRDLCKA